LFKHKKDDMRVIGKNGETIDLLYPKYWKGDEHGMWLLFKGETNKY
jgi:hypothetical protein